MADQMEGDSLVNEVNALKNIKLPTFYITRSAQKKMENSDSFHNSIGELNHTCPFCHKFVCVCWSKEEYSSDNDSVEIPESDSLDEETVDEDQNENIYEYET